VSRHNIVTRNSLSKTVFRNVATTPINRKLSADHIAHGKTPRQNCYRDRYLPNVAFHCHNAIKKCNLLRRE
jgi:hypothetical protein